MNKNLAQQQQLLYQIMKIEFALIETSLYLNTHPNDQAALMNHNMLSQQLSMLTNRYEALYGPLTSQGRSQHCWKFINSPWPWEMNY